jgi:hypothetical protein
MPLVPGALSKELEAFIKASQSKKQSPEEAIKAFCDEQERLIYKYIKLATITIPSGVVQVATAGSATNQTGANPSPVVLNNTIT